MKVPIWRVLGQSVPVATTATQLYVVATGRQATVNFIAICNQGAATTVRLSVRVGGVGHDDSQYLYYDLALQESDTFVHRGPMRLSTHDEVWGYSDSGSVSFGIFGEEEFV